MLTIDGSRGEGGGQVLRSSLTLSLHTGRPFCIERIRAARARPGLQRQHLTAVRAAAAVGGAALEGDELGSTRLVFRPGAVRGGSFRFDVGTAGSATLVLQTVLPVLLTAPEPSDLLICGGTHNPQAPPFDFLERSFVPLLRRMGPGLTLELERPGFFPAGGGRLHVRVTPVARLVPLHLEERGEPRGRLARATVAGLPEHIARRELDTLREQLEWPESALEAVQLPVELGPGNVVFATAAFEQVEEVATGFGRRGVTAERVATGVARELRRYLHSAAAAGEHLADQLLLPIALAGEGSFTTLPPTTHTLTNIEVIADFLGRRFEVQEQGRGVFQVALQP